MFNTYIPGVYTLSGPGGQCTGWRRWSVYIIGEEKKKKKINK